MKKKLLIAACLGLVVYGADQLIDYNRVSFTNAVYNWPTKTNYNLYFDDPIDDRTTNQMSWGTNVTTEIHTVYITNRFIRIQSPLDDKTILIKRLGTNVGDIYMCPPRPEYLQLYTNYLK